METNRRNFLKAAGITGAGLMIGCSGQKYSKSIENLKVAFVRESTTEEKYAKFAERAREEKFPKVATMFRAISKAEGIHAANHKKVLLKQKGTVPSSPVGTYEVKSTLENLQIGNMTEVYEIDTMYPAFIKEAKEEDDQDAINAFSSAFEVEIQHMGYYNLAITAFGTGDEMNMPVSWYVCPDCGGTYAKDDVKKTCYFDPTPKEQFLEFT